MTFCELLNKIACIDAVKHVNPYVNPHENNSIADIDFADGTTISLDDSGSIEFWGLSKSNVPTKLLFLVDEYRENKRENKGDNKMTKKEINEQITRDIQQLAKDLTKKKEIDQSTKITEKIADELHIKLPKRVFSDK